jgi:hypothetical protein
MRALVDPFRATPADHLGCASAGAADHLGCASAGAADHLGCVSAGAAALLALSATGCLITDTPQFQAAQHTAPFLVASTALPDLRQVLMLDVTQQMSQIFQADVISQDDPAGSGGDFTMVGANLYIDYGSFNQAPGRPFRYIIQGNTLAAGGTLDETTGRSVSATWFSSYVVSPGCHTATLVVSHVFDAATGCPACADDYSALTWFVVACDTATCAELPVGATMGACPAAPTLTSCVGESTCPENADGGTM